MNKSDFDQLQASLNHLNEEHEQAISKHQNAIKEINFKLTCAQAQVSQLQETKVETEKEFQVEKVGIIVMPIKIKSNKNKHLIIVLMCDL